MTRACVKCCCATGGQRRESYLFVSAPSDQFDQARWWCCREVALRITSEQVKFAVYLAGDPWIASAAVVDVLASLGIAIWRRAKRSRS